MTFDPSWRTYLNKGRIESAIRFANNLQNDPDAIIRQGKHECRVCHYRRGIAGQAFTDWKCQNCGKEGQHSNTAVPALCQACAAERNLCEQCGAEMD